MNNAPNSYLEITELATLPKECQTALRKILYRQECRAWLLAIGLPLLIQMVSLEGKSWPASLMYSAVTIYLAFWVIYPSQKVLQFLRSLGSPEDTKQIERHFDDSWASVWDFVPPIFLPVGVFLILLVYRLVQIFYFAP